MGLFVDDAAFEPARLLADLSTPERDHYARLRGQRLARRYLTSRWLVRQHLAVELAVSARDIAIGYPAGQPPYCPDTALKIGLSHSGPACLSLLSPRGQAGCDIETVRARGIPPEQLAQHYFHPAEADALRQAPAADRLTDFYRLWTLKEARLKAQGLGLTTGLAWPAFALRPRLRCRHAMTPPWYFAALDLERPAGRFALAVAATRQADAIGLEHFEPLGSSDCRRTPITQSWRLSETQSNIF